MSHTTCRHLYEYLANRNEPRDSFSFSYGSIFQSFSLTALYYLIQHILDNRKLCIGKCDVWLVSLTDVNNIYVM